MNRVRGIKGKKKMVYKYLRSEKQTKISVDLLQNVEGELLMDDAHRTKVFNPSFSCPHKGRSLLPEIMHLNK